jgi:hypothetical protein
MWGNPVLSWIPAGVYPDENWGENDITFKLEKNACQGMIWNIYEF